jgi:hypothetical protein
MSAEIYFDAPDLNADPDAVWAVKNELVTVEFAAIAPGTLVEANRGR